MTHILLIGNIVKSGIFTFKKYRNEIIEEPFKPEIKKLRKEREKWTAAVDLIGREYHRVGETCYEIGEDVISSLSAIECVVMPCARNNIFIPNKVYFYTDSNLIKKVQHNEDNPSFRKIYPQPEKAIPSIEKVIEEYISKTEDIGYILNFKKRREEIINDLWSLRKRINTPYQPGFDYSMIQEELLKTSKKMTGVEYDLFLNIQELEHKRNIKRAKIGTAAAITFAVGVIIGSKLKKAKSLGVVGKFVI